MNIIDIDKGFVEIVDFLNSHDYRPVFSCDGIAENHDEKIDRYAYLTLLESEKVYELMAVLLQTSIFEVDISNSSHVEPYEMYGNTISGNRYGVYFHNINGSKTGLFKYLIEQTDSGEIVPQKEYLNIIKRTANVVRDEEDYDNMLKTEIGFNHKLLGQFGEGIMVDISIKDGASVKVNLKSISEDIYQMFKEDGFDMEFYSESNLEINPDIERAIFSFDNQILRMHFKNEDFDKVVETIDFVKTMEENYYFFPEEEDPEE